MNKLIIHTLRNFGTSNLNRGKDGSPKWTIFGGVRRNRISSQAVKRSLRMSLPFDAMRKEGKIDSRTRSLPGLVADELERKGAAQEAIAAIKTKINDLGKRPGAKKADVDTETKQLISISPAGITHLADDLLSLYGTEKFDSEKIDTLLTPILQYGIDTALFGSMSTSAVFPSVDAACYVSHPFGVERAYDGLVDYFTAVDDLTGSSGFLGEAPFSGGIFYGSIIVSLDQLWSNLNQERDALGAAVEALLLALVQSVPTGKQHTFSSSPFPSLLMVESRPGQAFDHADAFVKPVEPFGGNDLISCAFKALFDYVNEMDSLYGFAVERAYLASGRYDMVGERMENLKELISWTLRQTR